MCFLVYFKLYFICKMYLSKLAPMALWTAVLCCRHPEFESRLKGLSLYCSHLSPTSLPVSSNLSNPNKGKNGTKKKYILCFNDMLIIILIQYLTKNCVYTYKHLSLFISFLYKFHYLCMQREYY